MSIEFSKKFVVIENGEESDLERIALSFSNNNKFEEVSKARGKGNGRCELNIELQHSRLPI